MYMSRECIDAGSRNCPCVLAETGDCFVCSRLSGSDKCDCSWNGVCIYNEFIQNNRHPAPMRKATKMEVDGKTLYNNSLLVLKLKCSRAFALHAGQQGTFVFIKPQDENDAYYMPVSIMEADDFDGSITLAVKVQGPKSKKLAEAWGYDVRGVYRNGLLGKGTLFIDRDKREGADWLVVAKGIGLAPAAKMMRYAGPKVRLTLMLDEDKITEEFAQSCLAGCGNVDSIKCGLLSNLELFDKDLAKRYDRIMIFTSNFFIKEIRQRLDADQDKIIYCNNFNMCCGEGICGACSVTDHEGKLYKTCKCVI